MVCFTAATTSGDLASGFICKAKKRLVLKAPLMDVWDVVKRNGYVKDATRDELVVLSFNLPPFPFPLKTAASRSPAANILPPKLEGEQHHIQEGTFSTLQSTGLSIQVYMFIPLLWHMVINSLGTVTSATTACLSFPNYKKSVVLRRGARDLKII